MDTLHVRDTAGIGSLIAKYMDNSTVYAFKRYKKQNMMSDKYNIGSFYGTEYDDCSIPTFLIKALWKSRHYDTIILHDLPQLILGIRILNRKARIILYYHGTILRTRHAHLAKYDKYADVTIVTTANLLRYRPSAVHMPNLVDTEHFKPLNIRRKKELLIMRQDNDPIPEKLLQYSHDELTRESDHVPYSQMPELFNRYTLFANPKTVDGKKRAADTWTGLEYQALACGLKVYRDGQWHYGLPEQCKPENYIKRLKELIK